MKSSERKNSQAQLGKLFEDIGHAFQYVFGVILSQGIVQKDRDSQTIRNVISLYTFIWILFLQVYWLKAERAAIKG